MASDTNEREPLIWDGSGVRTSTTQQWEHDGSGPVETELEIAKRPYRYKRSGGQNIPNFHARKKRGELLPFTRWAQDELEWDDELAYTLQYTATQWKRIVSAASPGIQNPTVASCELKMYDASYFVQAAASKIYSRGWDALTFAAELQKTASMFRNFLRNRLVDLLKLRWAEPYLEARYGWRTLYYDMKDIEQAIQNIDDKRKRFVERVGTNLEEVDEYQHTIDLGGVASIVANVKDTYKIGIRGTVAADIEPPKIAINPITTGWELITFSFVIDWVVNVGQFLEAMSFLVINRRHTAAEGWQIELKREVSLDSTTSTSGWDLSTVTCTGSGRCIITRREATSVSKLPLVKLRLDGLKSLDLLALVLTGVERSKKWRL